MATTDTYTLSYGRAGDLKGCYQCDLHGYSNVWSPASWSNCLADRDSRVFVVRCGGRVVGTVTGTRWNGYTDIKKLTVLPEYRRRGLARRLVEGLGDGELRVVLAEGNLDGQLAAKAMGFRAVKVLRSYFEDQDGVLMVRGQ